MSTLAERAGRGWKGRDRALIEVSGGITLESVRRYAGTGADMVSSGSLTNSAAVLDIGLDITVGEPATDA